MEVQIKERRRKRTLLCNEADRGCNITSRESGQTSDVVSYYERV